MVKKLLFLSILCSLVTTRGNTCAHKPRISILVNVPAEEIRSRLFIEDILNFRNFDTYELVLIIPGHYELLPMIQEYATRFPNIRYLPLENNPGVSEALNQSILTARADLLTMSSVDDRLNAQMLDEQIRFLEENQAIDLVYTRFIITDTVQESFEKCPRQFIGDALPFSPAAMNHDLVGPMPVWRRSMHQQYGYFCADLCSLHTTEFWNRAASNGSVFSQLDGYGACYLASALPDHAPYARELAFIRKTYSAYWNSFGDRQKSDITKTIDQPKVAACSAQLSELCPTTFLRDVNTIILP